jgi:hypothetical protein
MIARFFPGPPPEKSLALDEPGFLIRSRNDQVATGRSLASACEILVARHNQKSSTQRAHELRAACSGSSQAFGTTPRNDSVSPQLLESY